MCYSMCDLIKLSSIQMMAVVERLYAAPILCRARIDLALESAYDIESMTDFGSLVNRSQYCISVK